MTRIPLIIILALSCLTAEARIRNRRVKEAPKACKVMAEDEMLSRDGKRVLGTLRHSLLIESEAGSDFSASSTTISLVKDKGEKICQWTEDQWNEILVNNKINSITSFKFFVDEYKEILYPYAKKDDNSYFLMSIPFSSCQFAAQLTKENLELPKCGIQAKSKKKNRRKSSIAKK